MTNVPELVAELFPESDALYRLQVESEIHRILESKDVGKFKGDISVFKQAAIGTAQTLPGSKKAQRALEKDALAQLDKRLSRLEKDMISILNKFRAGKISKTKFRNNIKSALRVAYTDAYRLGTRASGLIRATDLTAHLGAGEKRWLDNMFSQEQKYFNKFLKSIEKGKSKTTAERRIGNYVNAVRSVFESSKVLQLPDDVLIHWVMQSRNPCPECRLLHRLSPFTKYTLPTTPKAGSTRCLAHCYCKLRIVKAKKADVQKAARKNKNAEHLIKKLRDSRKQKA